MAVVKQNMEIPNFVRNWKQHETEAEDSTSETLRREGFDPKSDYFKIFREPPVPKPVDKSKILKTKTIKLLFMHIPLDSEKRNRTRNCREYIAVDCQSFMLRQDYMHVELCFIESPHNGMNACFSSGADTDGVTFVYNKQYDPDIYKEIWDIEVTEKRYNQVYDDAAMMVGLKYDHIFIWCFLLQNCIPHMFREHRYTCASAVATLMAKIGIGDDNCRYRLREDKNIMVDTLHELITDAYRGVNGVSISNQIIMIQKGKLTSNMTFRR